MVSESSKLVENLYLIGPITTESAMEVIGQIIRINARQGIAKPNNINLFINSEGGDVTASFGLIDIIRSSKIPIHTYGIGNVCSGALLVFANGEKHNRYLFKHTTIMTHDFYFSDAEPSYLQTGAGQNDYNLTKTKMISAIRDAIDDSTKTDQWIVSNYMTEHDRWLTVQDAIKLRLADKVIFSKL